jgi:putative molybdopterin biosynthesis protein
LGSGTRVLLEELLAQRRACTGHGTSRGFEHTEPSHAAVATGRGRPARPMPGLGIDGRRAPPGTGLRRRWSDERYHLVCLKAALAQPGVLALLQLLQTPAWQAELAAIPGYAALQSGEVLSMRRVLPWWDYRRAKAHPADLAGPVSP